jgi:uncharacterized protein YqcC (DUF446 family)
VGFNDLRRIIRERTKWKGDTGLTTAEYLERQRVKALLEQLRTNHIIAYRQRRDKWFEEHPDKQFFENTYEEFVRDCKLEEWLWYFIERVYGMTTNEQRYHAALVGSTEEEAQEERNKTDLDILNDYEKYDRYKEVLEIWTAATK